MDLDHVCSQMITVIHCSITRLSREGEVMRVYGDVQTSDHPLCTDAFLQKILQKKAGKKFPVSVMSLIRLCISYCRFLIPGIFW